MSNFTKNHYSCTAMKKTLIISIIACFSQLLALAQNTIS